MPLLKSGREALGLQRLDATLGMDTSSIFAGPRAPSVSVQFERSDRCEHTVAPSSIARIIDRFGHLGAIRESLLARPDLPLAARQSLVRQLSGILAEFRGRPCVAHATVPER